MTQAPKGKHNAARKRAQFEQFAQMLAKGKTPAECYAAIFPKTKYADRNVGRYLKQHPEIEVRAREISDKRVDTGAVVISRAEELAAVNKAFVLVGLKENYERCMQHRPVLDRDGDMVYVETPAGEIAPAYAYDAKNALRALHLMGLEVGMFVHRHALVDDPFKGVPHSDVKTIREALLAIRADRARVIEHGPQRTEPAVAPALAAEAAA